MDYVTQKVIGNEQLRSHKEDTAEANIANAKPKKKKSGGSNKKSKDSDDDYDVSAADVLNGIKALFSHNLTNGKSSKNASVNKQNSRKVIIKKKYTIAELNKKYGKNPAPFETKGVCSVCNAKDSHWARTCNRNKKRSRETSDDAEDSNYAAAYLSNAPVSCTNPNNCIKLYADSGCTRHMAGTITHKHLTNVTSSSTDIRTFGGATKASHKGDYGPLTGVLLVPSAHANLLSISQLCDEGNICVFDSHSMNVYHSLESFKQHESPILTGQRQGGLYEVSVSKKDYALCSQTTVKLPSVAAEMSNLTDIAPDNQFTLWHNRLGHINPTYLLTMFHNKVVKGLTFTKVQANQHKKEIICEGCALGKMTMQPIRRHPLPQSASSLLSETANTPRYKPGQLVVIDLLFSNVDALISNTKIALLITDVATKYNWIYFLRNKDEDSVTEKLEEWLIWMRSHGIQVSAFTTIRSDNGTEFTSASFKNLTDSHGIKRERCPPYTHVHMAERANRSIQDTTRAMLHAQNVPTTFWAEAASYAVYVLNRTVCKSNMYKTKFELMHGVKPDISHLRTFGCGVYAKAYNNTTKKWDPQAFKGRFVGIDDISP